MRPTLRTTAIDCLGRGLSSLRANWRLVPLYLLESLLVAVLLAVGLLAPLLVVGGEGLGALAGETDPAVWEALLGRLRDAALERSPALAGGLIAMAVLWALALVVYSWFTAGGFGVLWTADRQALPGRSRGWRWFRTFSLRDFAGWGGRHLGRFFWFFNLYALLVLVLGLLAALLTVGSVWGRERWGDGAAVGIGCGGSLPLVFLFVVLALCFLPVEADLARPASGVFRAARRGLDVLGRRTGATVVLTLVTVLALAAVAAAFLPVSLLVALATHGPARMAARVVVWLLQSLVSGAVGVFAAASFVALVRSEESAP